MNLLATSAGDILDYALAAFFVASGARARVHASSAWEARSDGSRRSSRAPSATCCPSIVKAGGTVDRVNDQLDKLDVVTDSAVSMADSADTAVRAVSTAITTPVKKVSGFAAGVSHGVSRVPRRDAMRARRSASPRTRLRGARASSTRSFATPARRSRRARLRRRSRVRLPATPLVESSGCARPPSCARASSRSSRSGAICAARRTSLVPRAGDDSTLLTPRACSRRCRSSSVTSRRRRR